MDEIILRFLQGAATPEEEAQLRAWRDASSANEREFRGTERLWRITREAERDVVASTPTADALIRKPIHGGVGVSPIGQRRRPRLARWTPAAAAAGLLLVVGLGWLLTRGETEPFPFRVEEFSTGASERVTVRLDDGSVVRLAPESRLQLVGSGREVWLEGQAFFGVARNEEHPFVVRTRMGEAVVLGTRFDVRVRRDDLRLVVVDGRVNVSAAGEQVGVGAGQMTVVAGSERPAVLDVDDVYPLIDWLGRSLIFQNTPLSQAASELERAFEVRIDILGSELPSRTVTASFTDESFEEAFTIVCAVVGATCRVQDGVATMSLSS